MLHERKVGRVIARPFSGEDGTFQRTLNRHDYAIATPSPTLCDWVHDAGRSVQAIGKIGDIFSMRGIDEVRKGSDATLMDHLSDLIDDAPSSGFVFANFVEFDKLYEYKPIYSVTLSDVRQFVYTYPIAPVALVVHVAHLASLP